ncbi:hemolysin [Vibrio metoecus]|uniref:Hemolysin n=1 Tax=Vibrio metoecus TaxID=1481663 RepID=A0A271VWZ2_VIBMT|nr:beta-prism lectin domain-containing protein [Vibrio metoecus]EEX66887.1 hemolysin-related protein Vcp [Vibrio metoecus]KQA22245.1 hemolysin [Vibrio metoecus]KQB02790.1 hemolysin [Vibrio metoecus]KQB09292.1 hemolysin [Vibrio metoecus]PAR22614.1 hemolysin [Vibrio metoecus]
MKTKLPFYSMSVLALSSLLAQGSALANNEIPTKLKWSWSTSTFHPESNQVMAAPIAVQLNDDNGDGKIDEKDTADIIVVTFEGNQYANGGYIRALSGVDGSELWSYSNGGVIADARYSPAAADLDGDGLIEIVSTSALSPYITILDHQGNIKKQLLKSASGWRSVGDIALADINGDGHLEILAADGVYSYESGLLFSHDWAPSSIAFDSNGNGQKEVFANGALYQNNGAYLWQYQANDTVWFSSVANLDGDNNPELVVSVPASLNTAQNSEIAVLEHDGTVKWRVNNLDNPGGSVQAVSSFLGTQTESVSQIDGQSSVYGYTDWANTARILAGSDHQIAIRSGSIVDAIGANSQSMVGGSGGSLRTLDTSKVRAIDVTYGKFKDWWSYGILEMSFTLDNGSKVTVGSKDSAFTYLGLEWKTKTIPYLGLEWRTKTVSYWFFGWHTKQVAYLAPVWKEKTIPYLAPVTLSKSTTVHYDVPQGSQLLGMNVWSKEKALLKSKQQVNAVQFLVGKLTADQSHMGIVYAGYYAVDMYDINGNKVWSVANDDLNSGKIGVSAYDFTGDGIDEVLVQDRLRMRILDGKTGRVLSIIANSSGTLWEYPIVVDLAGNDNAALIMVANDYDRESQVNHGVFVYESADPSKPWKKATRIWNQYAFNFSDISANGTVPAEAQPSWLTHNSFRSATIRTPLK